MFQLLPYRNTQRLRYEDRSINPVSEIVVYCENCIPFCFLMLRKPGVSAELI